ncbi:MAG: hypothetical protein EP329_18835 [Deltaproteobacteria bacterium]|nr:MAG: hypothetical protein EP329_18835 [Deltaproteobacteria bacterium]
MGQLADFRRALAVAALVASGCAEASDATPIGPDLAIDVAALNLSGVGDVVWDLEVVNGAAQSVWQKRITSSSYGDGAGSASMVGPCDADPAVAENTVRVWVVGVYQDAVPAGDAGVFASGAAGGVTGTALDFQNPTTDGPLTRVVTCRADVDLAVQFDVALMRPAQQGFFDIAVSFDDVYCSAKFDCCREVAGGGCEDIALLHDASGSRARTFVLGFACTAGTASGVDTALYLDDLALDCDVNSGSGTFAADVTVHPSATTNGNLCTPGADGMSTCAAITEAAGVDADAYLFQVATYHGEEPLAGAQKAYWNVALGVGAGVSACTLRTRGTVDDAADTADQVDGGVIAPGVVYPYIQWDVPLGTCATEPLTFGDPAATVRADYLTTGGAGETFGYLFGPGLPASGAVCNPVCQNGGACVAPNTCDCDGTGYTGATCEQVLGVIGDDTSGRTFYDGAMAATCLDYLNSPQYTGSTGDGMYWIEPTAGNTYKVWCDMTTETGGWLDVVKTFHAPGASVAALTTAFFYGQGTLTGSIGTSAAGDGIVLVTNEGPNHNTAFYLRAPQSFSSVRLDYRMQGSEDGTRCSTANWVPLNGPGFDGGYDGYFATCPGGYTCLQGRCQYQRDTPIAVSGYSIDGLPATTLLTWSGSNYAGYANASGCTRDPDIPTASPSLYVTKLLIR